MKSTSIGIISLSNSFLRYLRTPSVRRRIAPLQLAGRLEDYLVKEFMRHVFHASNDTRFCEVNLGNKLERRVDIAFVRSDSGGNEVVETLIEAKYLQNRGHRSGLDHDKYDEIKPTLSDLRDQLRLRPRLRHGRYKAKLRARTVRVYGLVFASYVHRVGEPDRKKRFIKRVLSAGKDFKLQFHDLPRPYLRSAYEDYPITVLGEKWEVTLRGGLWRPKEKLRGPKGQLCLQTDSFQGGM
jgi:hypothetical protein